MPISCQLRDCKALLVTRLTHVSSAVASTRPLPLPLKWRPRHDLVYSVDVGSDTPICEVVLFSVAVEQFCPEVLPGAINDSPRSQLESNKVVWSSTLITAAPSLC